MGWAAVHELVVLGMDSALKWPWPRADPGVCVTGVTMVHSFLLPLPADPRACKLPVQPWHCTLTLCCTLQTLQTSPKLGQGSPGPGWSVCAQPALSGHECRSWLHSGAGDCQVLMCSFISQLIQRQRELGVNEAGCGFRQVRIACVPLVGMNHQGWLPIPCCWNAKGSCSPLSPS